MDRQQPHFLNLIMGPFGALLMGLNRNPIAQRGAVHQLRRCHAKIPRPEPPLASPDPGLEEAAPANRQSQPARESTTCQTMTRYPLSWPTGWKRTEAGHRKTGRFKSYQRALSVAEGADRTLDVLRRMGINEKEIVISTNVEPTLSGRPRSNQAEPKDPGVAVYWTVRRYQWDRKGNNGRTVEQHRVMAIDLYTCVADNLGAVAATLEAMRAIERHGGAQILERAFSGFDALPSPNDWRHVLGFEQTPTFDQAKERYRELAQKRHPDRGGSEAAMAELNRAWEQAQSDYARSL